MTYLMLNEENNTYAIPPTNKGNICNYNLDTALLEKDGYTNVSDEKKSMLDKGTGVIKDGDIVDITGSDAYIAKVCLVQQIELVEKNYQSKAYVAYAGVYFDYTIGDSTTELIFQTNSTSSSLIASTHISFSKEASVKETVNWKCWTVDKDNNYPIFVLLTKDQFLQFYDFAEEMIGSAVDIESIYNTKIQELTAEQLLDATTMNALKASMVSDYDKINTKITLV